MIHEVRAPQSHNVTSFLSCPVLSRPVPSHPHRRYHLTHGLKRPFVFRSPSPSTLERVRAYRRHAHVSIHFVLPSFSGRGWGCAWARFICLCPFYHITPSDVSTCCMYAYVLIDSILFLFIFRSATKSAIRRKQKDEKVVVAPLLLLY
jgi:hypothetical protein